MLVVAAAVLRAESLDLAEAVAVVMVHLGVPTQQPELLILAVAEAVAELQ